MWGATRQPPLRLRHDLPATARLCARGSITPGHERAKAPSNERSLSPESPVPTKPRSRRVRVAYLSYDGALDPLGSTQVIPYLEGLSRKGCLIDLITFEKPSRLKQVDRVALLAARLARAGIVWHALRYHRTPRVPATLLDVGAGAIYLRRLARAAAFDVFHCRGEITPVMVRLSRLKGPLLLDMRGFFSDERVDAGSWAEGGLLDRGVRAMEAQNLIRATRVVVLTERGRMVLRGRGVKLPIDVIPTCVDLERFKPAAAREAARFDLVYFGSLGGWYMTDAMLDFVEELRETDPGIRFLFLTNDPSTPASARLRSAGAAVRTASPEEVPGWLAQCRAAFFFIRATPSKMASCPTKLAEALAMGLPVLTGPGVGDVDTILGEERVGVVLDGFFKESFQKGWRALLELLAEPGIRDRCRSVAESRLSLAGAVEQYDRAYKGLVGEGSGGLPGYGK